MSDILSSTVAKLVDKERDALFQSTALLDAAKRSGKLHTDASGVRLSLPVVMDDHSDITEFTGAGYQAYDLNVQDTMDTANYEWSMNGLPAVISGKELMINSGPERRVELAEQRIRQIRARFSRAAEQQWLSGDASGMSQWNTLNGDGTIPGFLYHASATPTSGATVGGIARSSAIGLQNIRVAVGSGDSLRDALTDADVQAQSFNDYGKCDCIIMSPAGLARLTAEDNSLVRYNDDSESSGKVTAYFRGTPVYVSNFLPAGVLAYGISLDGIQIHFAKDGDFRFRKYERIPGTETELASIRLFGQLAANHLASSFVVVES